MIKATAPYMFILLMTMLGLATAASPTTPLMTASIIRDATVLEYTPDFTDLYIIEIQYKGKSVLIYCNSSACYKNRSKSLLA